MPDESPTTSERILEATAEVLLRTGRRKLSLSAVAEAAGVSRPTLYRWFPTKDDLLSAFGRSRLRQFKDGIVVAAQGLEGDERLDAVLRYLVDAQDLNPIRHAVIAEPALMLELAGGMLPVVQEFIRPYFPAADANVRAGIVVRLGFSHALAPAKGPDQRLRELRTAAGLTA